MQAVILAAGKSTRTYPLTLTKPKPLLKIANRPLLEHNLENLRGIVSNAVIVVGYKKELIQNYFGGRFNNIKIKYVEQKQQLGTAHAVFMAEPYVNDRFILMMGDDLYSRQDIINCIKRQYSILVSKVKNPSNFGVVIEKKGILTGIVEKPEKFVSDLASTAFYCLDKKVFTYIKKIRKSKRGEFEMPDAIKLLAKKQKIHCIKSKKWLPIVYAWDLLKADKALRGQKNLIGANSKIPGKVENSSIGNGCIIGGIVKNSVIMDNTIIENGSVVEDSVIGDNVHFQGIITSKNNSYSYIKNKRIMAGRLGAIISDNSNLINVRISAGCKISPGRIIENRAIMEDI